MAIKHPFTPRTLPQVILQTVVLPDPRLGQSLATVRCTDGVTRTMRLGASVTEAYEHWCTQA